MRREHYDLKQLTLPLFLCEQDAVFAFNICRRFYHDQLIVIGGSAASYNNLNQAYMRSDKIFYAEAPRHREMHLLGSSNRTADVLRYGL